MHTFARLLVPAAIAAALLLGSRAAVAQGLSVDETGRLLRGDMIVRTQSLDRGTRHYVGGVTYTVLDTNARELAGVFDDVRAWRRILPGTRSVRVVGVKEGDSLIEVTQGNALVQSTYTMRVQRRGGLVRFWMDPTRPHDLEDAWGFVRVEDMGDGRTLVRYGVLIDLGDGIVRDLFEDRVRHAALSLPERLRAFMVERSASGQRASR